MPSKSSSRNTSPKTPSTRPRLMRASATCPQLATSNASRKDLATLQSYGAATILTRVASYSTAQHEHAIRHSPSSSCSSPLQSPASANMERKEPFENATQQYSGNYFSFPSFEDFEEFEEDEARIDGRQEKGVP
ncbi:hypothetical protein B0O99DRAFT_52920 [Bisporella sp. PMI_857]|nr:hypothetical protein B0O99DRAFT_52920 [Bisporella sp. PMI_857]